MKHRVVPGVLKPSERACSAIRSILDSPCSTDWELKCRGSGLQILDQETSTSWLGNAFWTAAIVVDTIGSEGNDWYEVVSAQWSTL